MAFFTQLLIGLALNIVAYLLLPKPKGPKPPEVQDQDAPTAEAGRPIPVLFGTMRIDGLNIIAYTDKSTYTYEVSGGGKK